MYIHKDYNERVTEKKFSIVQIYSCTSLEIFMHQASSIPITQETNKMLCLCQKCKNTKLVCSEIVWNNLVSRCFTPQYYIWFQHGEDYGENETSSCNCNRNFKDAGNNEEPIRFHNKIVTIRSSRWQIIIGFTTRLHMHFQKLLQQLIKLEMLKNLNAKFFYEILDAVNQPIYTCCRKGLTKLSLPCRMITIKTCHNLPKNCMDAWDKLFKEYLIEDNLFADSYYEIQNLVYSLWLPSDMSL